MYVIARPELHRFQEIVAARFGLALGTDAGSTGTEAILRERLRATGARSVGEYLDRLSAPELRLLAERLTVGETYFFRYREQFDALVSVLPALRAATGGSRPLRILSAGCASGEEAGTLAILVRTALPEASPRDVSILGVDVNPAAIAKAKRGRYGKWSLRDTSGATRSRWFSARGGELELDPAARALLSFAEKNLGAPDDDLWPEGAYDVVFCRNVLMYFAPDAARGVIARIVQSMATGGVLFLGPTETHLGRQPGLRLHHTHGTFYHERVVDPVGSEVDEAPARAPTVAPAQPSGEASLERSEWGSARPRALSTAPDRRPAPPDAPAVAAAPAGVAAAMELLRRGRAAEALCALPPEGGRDVEALLLRAVLLTSSSDLARAEEACGAVLAIDPLQAGAHYLLALCREHAGDHGGAVEHDRVAAYLEPRFAMPHLHLGVLARRGGDVAQARREIGVALALLAEEDDARLVLFGGGLGREALIELCRAELRACGSAR